MSDRNKLGDIFYGDMLTSAGYDVENAIGLTYSLDLEALLSVSLSFGHLEELDEATRRAPLYLLEGIRRSSDKFLIFCNKGQIKVPQKNQKICSIFDKCVCEVSQRNHPKSNFHPKLWLVKEVNRDNKDDVQIKVIVLSRNLTFDNSLDVAVCMTGKMTTRGERVSGKQKPLIEMLESMKRFTRGNKAQADKVRCMIDDLKCVHRFELDDDLFEDYDFIPMCWDDCGERLTCNYNVDLSTELCGREMLIFSPFIDWECLDWLTRKAQCEGSCALFTRKEAVTKEIYSDFVSRGNEIFVMREGMVANDVAKIDLHAKQYFVSNPVGSSGDYLFVGSANATRPAFGSHIESENSKSKHVNVEFLLRLKYKRSRQRLESFKEQFIGGKEPMFESVVCEPDWTDDCELQNDDIKAVEDALKNALACGAFKAVAVEVGTGVYDISLTRKETKNSGCEFFIAPIQESANQKRFDDRTIFNGMPLSCVSEFYILTVKLRNEKMEAIVKIATDGIPDERDYAIFKRFIDTPEKFMRYVTLLLSDQPGDVLADLICEDNSEKSAMAGQTRHIYRFEPKLYEQMLKIAASNPNRFEDVNDVIRRTDSINVPNEFKQMYATFKNVMGKLE